MFGMVSILMNISGDNFEKAKLKAMEKEAGIDVKVRIRGFLFRQLVCLHF